MGKQGGIVQITGNYADVNFYQDHADGHLIRKKSSLTAERVKTDECYEGFRKAADNFKEAGASARRFRNTIRSILFPIADSKLSGRMNAAFLEILHPPAYMQKADHPSVTLSVKALKAFEFNQHAELSKTYLGDFTTSFETSTSSVTISIPPFDPAVSIVSPAYAHSFQFVAAAPVFHFSAKETYDPTCLSGVFPLDKPITDPIQLELPQGLIPGGYRFLLLGIVFYGTLKDIPRNGISQRKRMKLKPMTDDTGSVKFTGSLKIIHIEEQ